MISIRVPRGSSAMFKMMDIFRLVLLFAVYISLTVCRQNIKTMKEEVFYTCSMHPQIMEAHPGNCPICGMQLIPVQKAKTQTPDEVQLSDQQIALGNIHIDTVGMTSLNNETTLTATLSYDQQKLTAVSSRVMGRVEILYHKNIGEFVKKGDPLVELYSEELNTAKQEYQLALERRQSLDNSLVNFEQVISSAKSRLLLWGMTESQVNQLSATKKSTLNTTVYSNQSGYITELMVSEGSYIKEGGTIVQLADLSTLWVEAQLYTSQLSRFNNKSVITVQVPELGTRVTGKGEFLNPEIGSDKRINLLRVTIPNPNYKLKPGMIAYVILSDAKHNAISLPIDAVIRDSNGASVWVETSKNIFKNKMVTTGVESGNKIEITSGLLQGEAVVTSGAYLINSEYIFKNGAAPMAGMKM